MYFFYKTIINVHLILIFTSYIIGCASTKVSLRVTNINFYKPPPDNGTLLGRMDSIEIVNLYEFMDTTNRVSTLYDANLCFKYENQPVRIAVPGGGFNVFLLDTFVKSEDINSSFLKSSSIAHFMMLIPSEEHDPRPIVGPIRTMTTSPKDEVFNQVFIEATKIASEKKLSTSKWEVLPPDNLFCLPVIDNCSGYKVENLRCLVARFDSPRLVPDDPIGYIITNVDHKNRIASFWAFDKKYRPAFFHVSSNDIENFKVDFYSNGDLMDVNPTNLTIISNETNPLSLKDTCDIYGILVPGDWPKNINDSVQAAGYKSNENVTACYNSRPSK